jgi:HPt (histidine-containing phosphotransfer) domain-containing protein
MSTDTTNRTSDPPIKLETVLNACMGNAVAAAKVIDEFEKQMVRGIPTLEEGVRRGDARQTAELAHALKGVAGVMSAQKLRDLAAKLEQMGRAGMLEDAQRELAALRQEVQECLACLPALRRGLPKKA